MSGSPAEEADPIKVKEYIAAGIPFVGTNLPAIRQILRETSFGRICEPTSQSIVDTIQRVRNSYTDVERFA